MILISTIHQPLLPLRPSVRLGQLSFALLCTLPCRGYACPICNRSMVHMTRAWRLLDNEISRTLMPEECNNFNVKVDYVTILLFVLFFLFFSLMRHRNGSFEVFWSSLVENETWFLIKRQRFPLQTKRRTPNEFCQEKLYVLKCRFLECSASKPDN